MEYFKNRINSFRYAFSGLAQSFRQETHLKLHAAIALLVIGLGFFFDISNSDWVTVLLCITLVICLEMFNSALEKLCDLVMPERHPKIKYIKDVAAGSVLIACIFAIVAGLLVFLPYVPAF